MLADVPVVADASGLRRPSRGEERPACCCRSPSSTRPRATRSATRSGSAASTCVGLHVELGADDVSQTRAAWAGRALPIPVKVVPSPYRDLGQPLLAEIRAITADPDAVCVVVMPEIISPHRWQRILHNQRALFIKRLLLFEERVVLTSVPYRAAASPVSGRRAPARSPRAHPGARARRSAPERRRARAGRRRRARGARPARPRSRASRPRRSGGSSRASPARWRCSRSRSSACCCCATI